MPSPFPGMDPYVEHSEFFPDFHDRYVPSICDVLQARLPEPYYAMLGSRVWIDVAERVIKPDVDVLHPKPTTPRAAETNGGVAVAEAIWAAPVLVHVPQDETNETFVEIYTRRGGKRLVTSIEVLSLSNKTPGEHGRDLYLQKQREVLRSKTNLVEMDLLRGGTHTTAVPLENAVAAAGRFDYHVCIRRFDDLQHYFIYPIGLQQRLPVIPIPLLPGDSPVPLDLQTLFDRCYDAGPYRRVIPYREVWPEPPLQPDQAEWAQQLLRDKGLLPTA